MRSSQTCLVGVRTEAEVLDGLTGVLGTAEEDGVGASGGAHGELIDGEALTTGGQDAGTGSCGETEGRNGELGNAQETVVVSDGANNDDGLARLLLGGVLVGDLTGDARDGHGWAVDLAHHQAAEDDSVELGVGTAFFASKCQHTESLNTSCRLLKKLSARCWCGIEVLLTAQESVELDEQSRVGVVRLWRLAVAISDVVTVQINTHFC